MFKKVFLIFLIASSIYYINRNEAKPEAKKRLKIGVLPAEISFPFHICKQEGLFEKYGWNVEIISFQSAVELNQSFQTKDIDIILNDLVTAVLLKDAGLKVSTLGLTRGGVPNEGRIAIIASPSSGIHSLKDLENNSIALSLNTHAEFVLDSLVSEEGVASSKISKIRIPKIPVRLNLLLANKVPAAVLPEPMATLAIKEGGFLLRDDADENYSQIVLIAHDAFTERESENLHEFIQAYDEAVDLINAHPEKYRKTFLQVCSIPQKLTNSYHLRKFSYIKPLPKDKFLKVYDWLESKKLISNQVTFEDVSKHDFLPSSTS